MSQAKEEQLKKKREEIVRLMKTLSVEVEKIDYAIGVLRGEVDLNTATVAIEFTEGGTIRGLGEHILNLIEERGPLRLGQITGALFSPTMPISRSELRRRISVHCCDLHKKHKKLVSTGLGAGREIIWALAPSSHGG